MACHLFSKYSHLCFYLDASSWEVWPCLDHMVNKVGYLFDEFIERFDAEDGEREWGQGISHESVCRLQG